MDSLENRANIPHRIENDGAPRLESRDDVQVTQEHFHRNLPLEEDLHSNDSNSRSNGPRFASKAAYVGLDDTKERDISRNRGKVCHL